MCVKCEFSQRLKKLENTKLNFLCSSGFHYFCSKLKLVVIVSNCSAWRREGSKETLLQPFNIQKGVMRQTFTEVCSDSREGSGFKMKEGRFRSDKWKKSFAMRIGRNRSRLPKEAQDVPTLDVSKVRFNVTWSNLG